MNESAPNYSIINLLEPEMSVCEIGVADGLSSYNFLKKGCFLYMVDLWEDYPELLLSSPILIGEFGQPTIQKYDHENNYKKVLEMVKDFSPDKYKILRYKSSEIVDDIPNDLGLVYIDGNHAYEFVKQDIKNYWPKIKQGGWLTGDDISMESVAEAVAISFKKLLNENPNIKMEYFGRNWAIQKV